MNREGAKKGKGTLIGAEKADKRFGISQALKWQDQNFPCILFLPE